MLDIRFIRDNKKAVAKAIKDKGVEVDLEDLLQLDEKRRGLIAELESLRQKRNQLAADQGADRELSNRLKKESAQLESDLRPVQEEFEAELYKVPNIPSEDTPVGNSEAENLIVRQVGQLPEYDFEPKPHWEMTQYLDEERAVRISGKRFTFLKGDVVFLHLALIRYGFDVLTNQKILGEIIKTNDLRVSDKPFMPVLPPTMMRQKPYLATNRLQLKGDTFKLADEDLWLTGSAEHSLCAFYLGETLDQADLPVRLVGYNTAYRREVGSAGKDTRGMMRQHQFEKLEMESFSHPDSSFQEHLFFIAIQEYVTQQLGLPYQLVLKCTYDMGGPNIRGVDIETWMPGQKAYRETHSADYIGDYQARGLNTKFLNPETKAKELVHTNDATVFAQRTLLAILENNQTIDGKIKVPSILRGYLGGKEYLS